VQPTPEVPFERRAPASLLLVEDELPPALKLQALLAEVAGQRLWVWHERTAAGMYRMLTVCEFRVILLDLTLPDATPGAVLRRVKRAAPGTPVIILAGDRGPDGQETSQGHARLAGAAALVRKGEMTPLLRVLCEVLHMPHPPGAGAPLPRRGPPGDGSRARSYLERPAFNWVEAAFEGVPYVVRLNDIGDRSRVQGSRSAPAWIVEFEGRHHILMPANVTDTREHVIARAQQLLDQHYGRSARDRLHPPHPFP
jgi:CheY-like chemotaxis protein